MEIYVAPSPGPGVRRRISSSGGILARWRQDGKEIYYVGPDGRLVAAEVNSKGGTIEVVQARPPAIPVVISGNYTYDVSANGQRFLVARPAEQDTAPLTLVQNWAAGLKK